jgi:hypothetical protein
MHGDDRIEQVGLGDPRVVRPDRLTQRPQRNTQDEPCCRTRPWKRTRRRRLVDKPTEIASRVDPSTEGETEVDEHDHAAALAWR